MGRPSPDLRSRLTFGKSPVRESRTPGPVRGDQGNPVPYRDRLVEQREFHRGASCFHLRIATAMLSTI